MGVVGRRRDLSWCRSWDTSMAGGGGRVGLWRLQLAGLQIFILLYKTPKRRRFDIVFLYKKIKII